jgi:hypothetical protein
MKQICRKMAVVLVLLVWAVLAGAQITPPAQSPPPFMNYQSIAKDPYNNVAKNRDIYVKISIYTAPTGGTLVWEETFVTKSNEDGLYTVVIGRGTKNPAIRINFLNEIDWGNGPFYQNTKVAVSPSIPAAWWIAADNYIDMGTFQWMSVPYAMFAGNATVNNVTTSIQPGPPNTFLITDSLGNVSWTTPAAAQQTVTNIVNLSLNITVAAGRDVRVPANTTSSVTVPIPGVLVGDPILICPQGDYQDWAIYSAYVSSDGFVKIRFANYTDADVNIFGSQYKIVILK